MRLSKMDPSAAIRHNGRSGLFALHPRRNIRRKERCERGYSPTLKLTLESPKAHAEERGFLGLVQSQSHV